MNSKNREKIHEKYKDLKIRETIPLLNKVEYLADYTLINMCTMDKLGELCNKTHKCDKLILQGEHVLMKYGPVEFSEKKLEVIHEDTKNDVVDYWVEEHKYIPDGKRQLNKIFMFNGLSRKFYILKKRLDILKGQIMARTALGYIILSTDPAGKTIHKIVEALPEKIDGKSYKIKKQKDIVIKLKRGDSAENDNIFEEMETSNPLCFIDGHLGKFKDIKDKMKIGSTLYVLDEPDAPGEGGLFVTKSDKKFLMCYNKGMNIVVDNLNDALAGEIIKIFKLKGMVTTAKKGRMHELDDNDEITIIGDHGLKQEFPCRFGKIKAAFEPAKLETSQIYIIEEEVKFGIGLK